MFIISSISWHVHLLQSELSRMHDWLATSRKYYLLLLTFSCSKFEMNTPTAFKRNSFQDYPKARSLTALDPAKYSRRNIINNHKVQKKAAILRLTHVQSCAVRLFIKVEPSAAPSRFITGRKMAGLARRTCGILPQLCNLSSKRAVLCSTSFQSKRLLHVARQLLAGKVMQIVS